MRPLMIAAALALTAGVPAWAEPTDSHKPAAPKAACHAADGKAQPCAPKKAAGKTKVATPMITSCRDVISHQPARCGGPNAEPVPAN